MMGRGEEVRVGSGVADGMGVGVDVLSTAVSIGGTGLSGTSLSSGWLVAVAAGSSVAGVQAEQIDNKPITRLAIIR